MCSMAHRRGRAARRIAKPGDRANPPNIGSGGGGGGAWVTVGSATMVCWAQPTRANPLSTISSSMPPACVFGRFMSTVLRLSGSVLVERRGRRRLPTRPAASLRTKKNIGTTLATPKIELLATLRAEKLSDNQLLIVRTRDELHISDYAVLASVRLIPPHGFYQTAHISTFRLPSRRAEMPNLTYGKALE